MCNLSFRWATLLHHKHPQHHIKHRSSPLPDFHLLTCTMKKKRVATKQYKYSPSRVQQSSIAIAKREGESSKSAVSEDSHGTKEKVATKHNKYSASPVVFTSPLQPVKHWYSQQHTQLSGMQFQSIFYNKEEKNHYDSTTNTHIQHLTIFSVIYSRGPTHPYINLQFLSMFCNKTRNIQKFPRYLNEHRLNGCMYTLSYFCGVGHLSSKIYSLVEPSQGRITLRTSEVSEIAMEQNIGLPQNNTFTFSYSTVQYSHHPNLARERARTRKLGSQ